MCNISFEQNTYHFKEGINIINADNNMGKSKFYNGILWILRDEVYDADLKRMEKGTTSYNKMASGKAILEENDFDMGTKIVFVEQKSVYTISKIVQFRKKTGGWNTNEKLEVEQTIDNRTIPISAIEDKDKIIRKIIPAELMNYALLQGESMEKLVDLSSRDGLSSTIETLAGIKNLIDICALSKDLSARTKNLCRTKEQETDSKDENKNRLLQEQEDVERRIDLTEIQIETYKSELSKAKEKREKLEALQLNAGKREKFRGEQKRLLSDINNLKDKKKEKEKNITTMLFSDNSPWLLMGLNDQISLFDQQRLNLNSELAIQKTIYNPLIKLPKDSPDIPSLQRMLKTEICEVCGRPAPKNSEQWEHIKMVLERPINNEIKSKNEFSSFYSGIQNTVGSFSLSIPKISDLIQEYRDHIDEIDLSIQQKHEEYDIVKTEFLNAGGSEISSEATDKNNLAEYSFAEKTIIETNDKIEKAEKQITQWRARLSQIEDDLKKNNSSDEIKKYHKFKEMMCNIELIFNNSKERIFDEILYQLEINANIKYRELTQDNRTEGGKLNFSKQADGTVQVSIKNINDGELTGLGTGFQRMKQLSIIMAIISSKIGNKQFDYPFISDAPFSEFGDNFINNFFKIAPNVFTQSIILIKELYDPNSNNYLNDLGNKILQKNGRWRNPRDILCKYY